MKIIKNATSAYCMDCGVGSYAELDKQTGCAVCENCGSKYLIDHKGDVFEPQFIHNPAKMYQASQYTPPLPDRRKRPRIMPKLKERREKVHI